ncbi:MAG: hypothetical protein MJ175_12765, partial [Clostridia bacterium]|nr:hypothetical protein [Clostridia bacterium]
DFQYADKWFASDRRGDFPMGWGLPATTIDTIAPMMDYFYEDERTGDEFLLELSGIGYTFPSRWSEDARRKTAETVASYMKRSDFRYLEVLDDNGFDPAVLSAFTSQDAVSGIFYIDYSNYAGKRGKVLWSDGKPMVSARYRLWADLSDGAIAKIADKVNKASTDTASEDAYSVIIVHAWSGRDDGGNLVPGGNTMDAIAALIDAFGKQVEVVTPDVFMERIKNNVSHP